MTLGEYAKEQIHNNRLTAKDVREGRTVFTYLDSLDYERRNQLLQEEHHKTWQSMTPVQQAGFIIDFEAMIRQKKRADNGKLK